MWGRSVFAAPIQTWMRPPRRSATAGAAPLYGTWFIFVPVRSCSIAAPRCCGLPLPEEPWLSSPGRDLAYATRSGTEFTGSEGCTTSRNWMRASCVTGMKSANGSNGCLPRCGLTENTLSGASSQVWPSGALFATRSAPMFWLPPGRFSTTTGCGHCNPALSARAMVSGEPPGVSGTMMRTGLSGKPCAWATVETRAARPAASHLLMSSSARFRAHSLPIRMRGIRCPFTEEEVMLTPEELAQLSPAESLFPSPIPVQFVSSDEYMPAPQSVKQKEFEARIKESGAQLAKKHGMSRRKFFKTAGGMAAAFAAMNEVHAKNGQPLYEVQKNEHVDLDVAQARADSLKNQFVMDMHTH